MHYHWNWHIYWAQSPEGSGTYLHTLIVGLGWTVALSLLAWALALLLGIVVGVIRTTPLRWLERISNAYVELFRNIPLLVQLFLWYFVMPELVPKGLGDWIKQMPPPWGAFVPAVLCLGTFTSARVAEQVRAGINSLARGQRMAGTALGLTLPQTYRYVLLPMAMRIIVPTLGSEFLNIIKNSAVALTINVVELTAAARAMEEYSFQVFEAFTAATVIYLLVDLVVVVLMHFIERRVAVPGGIGSAGGPKPASH
jgi:glutamate/aspartate transport system permease protein